MSGAGAAAGCPPLYLSPCDYVINSDLATNTTEASQHSSPPGCMGHSSKPLFTDDDREKTPMTGTNDEPSLKRSEQEANNHTIIEKRLLRSRRLSTLYQPSYYIQPISPPPCTPAFSTLFQDNPKEQEDSPYISSLPSSSIFQQFQKFRQSLHLSWLLPTFTFSFLDTPSLWLAMYFALNLSLTLYNKSVLIHFPFPYTLTALHALCGTIGASILLRLQGPGLSGSLMNGTTPKSSWSFFRKITPDLTAGESIVLLFFSMLYTINIVVSNASLRLVTVPVSYIDILQSHVTYSNFLISFYSSIKLCAPPRPSLQLYSP